MKQPGNPLHVLSIPGVIPYPPNDGGKLCMFSLIDYLRKYHTIQVLLPAHNIQDKETIQQLSKEWPDVTIHTVELYQPVQPVSVSSTKSRIKKIIKAPVRLLRNLMANNSVVQNSISEYDNVYRTMPFYPQPAVYIEKLIALIAQNKFDIIQTELTHVLNLVQVFPANVKKVFVQIEGRGDVLYDYGISHHINAGYTQYVSGNARLMEYAYMSKYDAVLTLNKTDSSTIRQNLPANVKVYTSPFGILDAEIKPLDTANYQAENLVFMGGESHYPNVDALEWFCTDVNAAFVTRPFKKLYVTGQWSALTKERLSKLCNYITFIGFVDDLAPYLKNSVSIVPIRIGGGGIRTKILSAMAYGSPVVATSLSAVGIKGAHQQQLLIADTAADFADAILLLFDQSQYAREMANSAYRLLVNEYSQSATGKIRNDIYKDICNIN